MKSRLFLGLALATAITLPAWAADSRTIAMTGHGETRGAPDMAQVTAGVSTMAPTAAQALSANSSHMKGVFGALVKLGVPERKYPDFSELSLCRRNTAMATTTRRAG